MGIGEKNVAINGYYFTAPVGLGVVTRCISECLPMAHLDIVTSGWPLEPRFKPYYELGYAWRRRAFQVRIHPYLAAAVDSMSLLVVHDLIGNAGTPSSVHKLAIARAGALATVSQMSRVAISQRFGREPTVIPIYPASEFYEMPRHIADRSTTKQGPTLGYWSGYGSHKAWELLDDLSLSKIGQVWAAGCYPRSAAKVKSCGRLDQEGLIRQIDLTDVGIFPSRAEGFGLPPLESALRGVPIVVRNLPAYHEFLDFTKDGLFPFDSDEEMPRAIFRALEFGRRDRPLDCVRNDSLARVRSDLRAALLEVLSTIGR